ncbi:MAG: hypothetical protein Q9207_005059 [Kuettlingeria erythrocarpa]
MHARILFPFVLAILPHLITSSPTLLLARQDGPGHPYECEAKYNVVARKKELVDLGANAQDLAIAIMETYVFLFCPCRSPPTENAIMPG